MVRVNAIPGRRQLQSLYRNARANTFQALDKIDQERNRNDPAALPNINLNNNERRQIVEFLESLTDPCVVDRACLSPWIPLSAEAPDSHQLNAVDANGLPL